ncbi:MAG: efflux RND transporter periplasmic adaptor subunit, partial [Burkholderiales bacterium]|nr:efflux RND transporter periplasmic adaptor subunit [Burkholderiales bacterium]
MNGTDGVTPAVRRRGWMMLGGVGLLGAVLFTVGYGPHVSATAESTAASDAAALPLVVVVPARKGKDSADVSFPATLQALQEATLYARTAGYVKRWHAEMGDRVKAGQLLAELEAPELDRELDQARAASAQARAHLDLARTTAERYRGLVKQEAVSSQEADERIGALAAREADYAATQARIRQLDSMKAFQRVVAPFSGTVVARNLEVGSLVAAGNSASTPWLYKIVQSDTLRVLVSVPQSHVAAVKTGTEAELHIRELGGKPIVARVVRNAGAFDSATRTLLTELRVPNPDGRIFPGMYGQVKFR